MIKSNKNNIDDAATDIDKDDRILA